MPVRSDASQPARARYWLGVHGTYSFVLPGLAPGAIRRLRNPDATDEDDERTAGTARSAARRDSRFGGPLVVLAQHAHDGRRGRVLALWR